MEAQVQRSYGDVRDLTYDDEMNCHPGIPANSSTREPVVARLRCWWDWWFAARWRALITWTVLAWISASLLEGGFRPWMDFVTRRLSAILRSIVGYSPPAAVLEMSSVFAVMCWFQPMCLRLGILRSALWIVVYVTVGLAIYAMYSVLGERLGEALFDAVLLPPMFGLPGLVAIGVRTRVWLSPCAAILSTIAVFAFWNSRGSLVPAALLANIPYALLMLYGTRPIESRTRDLAVHPNGENEDRR
jgi:hypothetical protein